MTKITVSEYIVKYLENIGVEYVFSVVGGGSMFLNSAFSNSKKIKVIYFHHEQACAIAAEGYARVSGNLAVVCVTTGPGGLNTLTGLMGAWTDSVPVLFISGQVKKEHITNFNGFQYNYRQIGDQEVNIVEIVKPLTKYVEQVKKPREINRIIKNGVWNALEHRQGPTWVDIPIDIQNSFVINESFDTFLPKNFICPTNKEDKKLYRKLNEAKRPLIVAGKGINISNSRKEFLQFIEKLNIPVVTSFTGFDIIPSDHPLFVGRCSTVGTRSGNFAVQNSDFILFLGTRNNIRQIGYNGDFAKNAYKACVDIDWNELNKPTIKYNFSICAELRSFFNYFNYNYERDNSDWINNCKKTQQKYPVVLPEYKKQDQINPYYFIEELTKRLSGEDIVVASNGTACVATYQASIVKKGQTYIQNSGCASMGYGLPAAIGACFANNRKEVICIEGDGSIMMNLQELQTVKHHNLPIKIFLLCNNGYASIKQTQNNFFNGNLHGCNEETGVSLPKWYAIAESFGLEYEALDNVYSIGKVLDSNRSVLCTVYLGDGYVFQPKCSSKKLEDGSIISSAYDDMYPFLSREEYKENKIVK